MQRHGVGLAPDMAAHHRDGAEFSQGAGVAEQHAIEQRPFDVGQRHAPESLKARGAQRRRRFFLVAALVHHQRDQFARHEGESDEDRGQHDAGQGEQDMDVIVGQRRPEPALHAKHQHIDQARHHRRDRERQVDQRHQEGLAGEVELGNGPGGGDAEDGVERHGDGGGGQGQFDRGQRVFVAERRESLAPAVRQRLAEDHRQRQHQDQADEGQHDGAQQQLQCQGILGGFQMLLHQRLLAAHACKPFKASSITKDAASITTPMAAAPA